VANDIPCREERTVFFPDTKRLQRCTLLGDHRIQGILFGADSIVGFDENGNLWRCNISQETVVGSIPCKAKTEVEFHPTGRLLMATLSREAEIEGVPVLTGTLVLFHENGNLFHCTLARDVCIQDIPVKAGADICFLRTRKSLPLIFSKMPQSGECPASRGQESGFIKMENWPAVPCPGILTCKAKHIRKGDCLSSGKTAVLLMSEAPWAIRLSSAKMGLSEEGCF
jgi:hypothetical protein